MCLNKLDSSEIAVYMLRRKNMRKVIAYINYLLKFVCLSLICEVSNDTIQYILLLYLLL